MAISCRCRPPASSLSSAIFLVHRLRPCRPPPLSSSAAILIIRCHRSCHHPHPLPSSLSSSSAAILVVCHCHRPPPLSSSSSAADKHPHFTRTCTYCKWNTQAIDLSWSYLLIGRDHLMMNLCMFELYIS